MRERRHSDKAASLLRSRRALTVPVTYLILFVSLIALISATYTFSAIKISETMTTLKTGVAKQNMDLLDCKVRSVAWSLGESRTADMDDSGGEFRIEPRERALTISFTNERTFTVLLLNMSVGKASYDLTGLEYAFRGTFIKGDESALINRTALTTTQIYSPSGVGINALILSYRPFAGAMTLGMSDGKPLNLLQVSMVVLSSSQPIALRERFRLKVTCINVTTISSIFDFDLNTQALELKATLDGVTTGIWLPISSNQNGAQVKVEITTCNVDISRLEV